ncbi:MAG: tRNA dihydrouridine(20/20a) synthase DusA [Gammaproteobacteria bacterium]
MRNSADCRKISVAPMMERTDRHCRYLLRLLARNAWLYTEMITAVALIRGDRQELLRYDPSEHPLALQLGGSDPAELAEAARYGEDAGYDEINLNLGCPSDRVQAGKFGAALMAAPERVAESIAAMSDAVDVPVTVKTRLGIDDQDSYEFLHGFVGTVAEAGCRTFIVHARKAWLSGLSPKENREIPPLDYARVHRLKEDYPKLEVIINGGLTSEQQILEQLEHVDGVMLGRHAYHDPYVLAKLDRILFGDTPLPCREDILTTFLPYLHREIRRGTSLKLMTRHLMGLYAAQPGGRRWRRFLSELPHGEEGLAVLTEHLRVTA